MSIHKVLLVSRKDWWEIKRNWQILLSIIVAPIFSL